MASSDLIARLRKQQVQDPLSPLDQSTQACARRLRLAVQMCDDGLQLKRSQIRREGPELTEDEVDERLREWLQNSPPPGYVEGYFVRNPHRFR